MRITNDVNELLWPSQSPCIKTPTEVFKRRKFIHTVDFLVEFKPIICLIFIVIYLLNSITTYMINTTIMEFDM